MLAVLNVLGRLLAVFSLTYLAPIVCSLVFHDGMLWHFIDSMAISAAGGVLLYMATRRHYRELKPRDGFLLVTLSWVLMSTIAAVPLMLSYDTMSFTDAFFETMSGLTTTGATVMTGLDHAPQSINLWRHLLNWIGGMGIIVFAVAILPLLGVGGAQLLKSETAGPMKDQRLTPRIAQTARGLWSVYFAISALCMLAYRWAGMSWSDAFMHMCATMGLGGFAAYDASFAAFDSARVEAVAVVFMLIAGLNFALYFVAWRKRSLQPLWRDVEARAFVFFMTASVLGITLMLAAQQVYPSFEESFRRAAFNVVSVATTTGFATVDYAQWPVLAPVLMLFLCSFATCAGSTGGGIKLIRSLLLIKQARRELTRIVHPRAVVPVTLGGQVVPPQVMTSVVAFMLVYGAVMVTATLLLLASGLDLVTASTAVIACINNTGPGLGQVGPSGNYQGLSDFQTWVCTFSMLLGRLELMSVLVLFTPEFWQR